MSAIRRVAVLGAGTMGSRIAALFANAGAETTLLGFDGESARKGLEAARQSAPPAFFTDRSTALVTPDGIDDGLDRVRDCDWVIEAIGEDLASKRGLWEKIAPLVKSEAALSTATTGIPLAQISEGFPPELCHQFLGTHFFNPPRAVHLVEVIPCATTDPEVTARVVHFCDYRLGKGVVEAKDTPYFIANRIACFLFTSVLQAALEEGYSAEEVDALTGPLIGLPETATLRLADAAGLDAVRDAIRNLHKTAPDDRWRERFETPPVVEQLVERGWLGEKSAQGFYRRAGRGADQAVEALDWKSFEYQPRSKPALPTLMNAEAIGELDARLQHLVKADDREGRFVWRILSDLMLYSAGLIPQVAARVVDIDRAMRWGFGFELGPFELWGALGFKVTARRMESEGRELPRAVEAMLSSGAESFYRFVGGGCVSRTEYFDFSNHRYHLLEARPGVLVLDDVKRSSGVVDQNAGASLIDLGDGVLCLEFHSKLNTLGADAHRLVQAGLEETEHNYEALVIANQGADFSLGTNLMLLLLMARGGEWDEVEAMVRALQQANMAIRTATKPVVAAPFGRTLGAGCEVALHAARRQSSAELNMGLAEVGVGLIPAGGGVKQLLANTGDPEQVFKLIGHGRQSGSADEAREMGLLSDGDGVTMNTERLVADAKRLALAIAPSYRPMAPLDDIEVGGNAVYAKMRLAAWTARQAGQITDHDFVVAEKLAGVVSGGRLANRVTVSEQHLLDLEREAFLSLCGDPKTQDRIEHMLRTGKCLRN